MERLTNIGKVQGKDASSISHSRLGIGFEKLDRAVFEPHKAYDKIARLGVKWVRIQSGWARTEREKGVYDFAWMDDIVDNLLSRGLQPWVCLCYGNGIYDENAAEVFGAVGVPPIFTEEQKQAWHNYVAAFVKRYKGKITHYEVWNEPDGQWCWKHGVSATELGNFTIATAKAIRESDADAYIIGGVVCKRPIDFINEALATGMADCINAVSFHEYTASEYQVFERVEVLKALCRRYNPKLEIIQGESGSQSRSGGHGALHLHAWTPKKQAKQLARHTMADLMTDVVFTSYFSSVDMIEALNGTVSDKASYLDYGYFGVLAADFDKNGLSTGDYTPKPSYYALQTIAALFSEDCAHTSLPVLFLPEDSPRIGQRDYTHTEVVCGGFTKPNGAAAFVYWYPSNILTTDSEGTVTLQFAMLPEKLRLVDLITGDIYTIPADMITTDGHSTTTVSHLPCKDYPLALTFGDFF